MIIFHVVGDLGSWHSLKASFSTGFDLAYYKQKIRVYVLVNLYTIPNKSVERWYRFVSEEINKSRPSKKKQRSKKVASTRIDECTRTILSVLPVVYAILPPWYIQKYRGLLPIISYNLSSILEATILFPCSIVVTIDCADMWFDHRPRGIMVFKFKHPRDFYYYIRLPVFWP